MCIAQFSIILSNHSESSGMLTVPEYSHYLITGRNLSVQFPGHTAKLPFARGLVGSHWFSSTDGLGGCVFVTVEKYYAGMKLQDWG